ncbi:MAG TPA: Sec-independent protein translocase protein TatB [Rhodocyclaceae bacterium]|jgi:sec-independent protein translocase protein TatB|nr:Sec-independent protein translocase protein TatB [Rhodocyclaceae bacterium]HRQ45954.1 Sec-independent protein translocase protein TatB [Rhodocyclaceae bacterium]
MFDFGFSELLLVALVALIVVGPERLPKVARTAGHLLGRLQRYVSDVKSDISREMQLEDLKKLQQQVEQQARELESTVRTQMEQVESDVGKTADEIRQGVSLDLDKPASPGALPEGGVPVSEGRFSPVASGDPEATAPAGDADAVKRAPDPQLELGLDPSGETGKPAEKA